MNKASRQTLRPLLLVFIFSTALLISFKNSLTKNDIDQSVLLAGNLVIFFATLGSIFISLRSDRSPNPQASVRSVYISFMIKFFLIAITAFAYIISVKKEVNKPALIACAGLYIIYTFIEVAALTRMLKNKKNA